MNENTRILLIEDDPGIADTLERLLTAEGYEILVEKRGDDGLARAANNPFNLVISDL